MSYSDIVQSERVTLLKEKLATQVYLDPRIFHDAKIDVLETFSGDLVARLSAYVYRNKDKPSVSVKFPKSVWDHFKQEYMPEWFTKRWPVKYTEVVHEVRQIWTGVDPGSSPEVIYQLYTFNKSSWFD